MRLKLKFEPHVIREFELVFFEAQTLALVSCVTRGSKSSLSLMCNQRVKLEFEFFALHEAQT